ncbi:hypothetical protein HaLaN_04697 [Haematococcus lacustris]|uniref:Uncharacterized protein n=1 Tax=Haematococcus lacustris TaxID=44745 RepID=A0A699Z296_HAELA|nr:hypothetical protein HaLaN_04697 [Haematococcus lacustris]
MQQCKQNSHMIVTFATNTAVAASRRVHTWHVLRFFIRYLSSGRCVASVFKPRNLQARGASRLCEVATSATTRRSAIVLRHPRGFLEVICIPSSHQPLKQHSRRHSKMQLRRATPLGAVLLTRGVVTGVPRRLAASGCAPPAPCASSMKPLSQLQQDIVDDPARAKLIQAVAGSGKTEVLVQIALKAAREGTNVLFVTKVSSVTFEIVNRLMAHLKIAGFAKSGNHYYTRLHSSGAVIEVANYDAMVHTQLLQRQWGLQVWLQQYGDVLRWPTM